MPSVYIGWRLVLVVVLIAVPFAATALACQQPAVRKAVLLGLTPFAVLALAPNIGWITPRPRLELLIGYVLLGTAAATAGSWWDRRSDRNDAGPVRDWRKTGVRLAVLHLVVVLLMCCAVPRMWNSEGFVPDSSELLPLPPGLEVTGNETHGVGTAGSARNITVASTTGASVRQVHDQVISHLRDEHFWSDDQKWCRPNGWLIDRTELCVEVGMVDSGQVVVRLLGARDPDSYYRPPASSLARGTD